MKQHSSQIKRMAREFRVWQIGKMMDWDCTKADIARATGIEPSLVGQIMKRRGWTARQTGQTPRFAKGETLPVDAAFEMQQSFGLKLG